MAIVHEPKISKEHTPEELKEVGALLYLQEARIKGALKAIVEDGSGELATMNASKMRVDKDADIVVKTTAPPDIIGPASKSLHSFGSGERKEFKESTESLELKKDQEVASCQFRMTEKIISQVNLSGANVGGSVSVSIRNKIHVTALPQKPREYPLLEQLKQGKAVTWGRGGELPRQDITFVGREALLEELDSKLHLELKETKEKIEAQNTPFAITACAGLGGIGKTQFALKYIRDTKNFYTLRVWFSAENIDVLQQGYMELAEALGYGEDKPSFQKAHIYLKRWLGEHPGWLLVYDNVTCYKDIKDFLPEQGGRVLLTTRQRDWPSNFKKLEIEIMTEEESIKLIASLIEREIQEKEMAETRALVKALGYLPLALAQAGAYLKVNNLSISKYLKLYKKYEEILLAEKPPEGVDSLAVAVTWDITLEAIIQESKAQKQPVFALHLLTVCAYLAPEKISQDLLLAWLKDVYPKLEVELILPKAIGQLWRYSMVNRDNAGNITVHRLVQSVLRYKHKKTFENENLAYFSLNRKWYEILFKVAHEECCRTTQVLEDEVKQKLLLPHLQALIEHFESLWPGQMMRTYSLGGYILEAIGLLFFSQLGDGKSALSYCERALIIFETMYEKEHAELVSPLVSLGTVYGALGHAEKGKEFLERALVMQERKFGKDHPEVANILVNLGNAYGDLGNAEKQRTFLERALVILESEFGKDHHKVANILVNLGNAYGDLGNAEKQRAFLERALVILESEFGKDHRETAIALGNLGNAYRTLGDAEKSKMLLERSLVIKEREYGKDNREVAITLANLGNAYGDLGNAEKQRTFLERALVIIEREVGKDHREVANILENLGIAYGALGILEKQKELLERALIIKEQAYGKNHREVGRTLGNLGNTYRTLGNIEKSKALLERALIIKENEYGKDHLKVAITLKDLSLAYQNLGDVKQAKELLEQRALPIFIGNYGEKHLYTVKAKSLLDKCNAQLSSDSMQGKRAQVETKSSKEVQGNGRTLLLSTHLPKILEKRNIIMSSELIKALEHCKIGKDGKNLPNPELALRRASAAGKIELVKTLMKLVKDIDINQSGPSGRTAIMFAKKYDRKEVVEFLISAGAKLDSMEDKKKLSTSISSKKD